MSRVIFGQIKLNEKIVGFLDAKLKTGALVFIFYIL
jgi:hypothetical protein